MSGNSWQQAVSGEFGRGTFKRHLAALYDDDPGIGVIEIDCSGETPKGCRMVLIHSDVSSTGAVYILSLYDDIGAAASALWCHIYTVSANADAHQQCLIGLDADRKFYFQAAHANINSVVIDMQGYWI